MKRPVRLAIVLWAILLSACSAGLNPGSGILQVSCTDNGNDNLIKQLYYSIDGGSQNVIGEGYFMQHWLDVGHHRLSGYWASWYGSTGQPGGIGYFDEEVYVWNAEHGETTWTR